jgi:hypothetical protein
MDSVRSKLLSEYLVHLVLARIEKTRCLDIKNNNFFMTCMIPGEIPPNLGVIITFINIKL